MTPMGAKGGFLSAYKQAMRDHWWVSPRDWLVSRLGNFVLSLGSPAYRRLVDEAIALGLGEVARRESSQTPFKEPMDDPS